MSKSDKGLYGKYRIEKANGEPISDEARYFVLRHDQFGDHCHVEASRKALKKYAKEIKPHIPELAEDLFKILERYE